MKRMNKISKKILKKRGNKQEIKKNIIRLMNELTNLLMELDEEKENTSDINEIKDMKNNVDNIDVNKLEDKVEDIKENMEMDNSEEKDIDNIVEDIRDLSEDEAEIPTFIEYSNISKNDILKAFYDDIDESFAYNLQINKKDFKKEYPELDDIVKKFSDLDFIDDLVYFFTDEDEFYNDDLNNKAKEYCETYNLTRGDIAEQLKKEISLSEFSKTILPNAIDFYKKYFM